MNEVNIRDDISPTFSIRPFQPQQVGWPPPKMHHRRLGLARLRRSSEPLHLRVDSRHCHRLLIFAPALLVGLGLLPLSLLLLFRWHRKKSIDIMIVIVSFALLLCDLCVRE